MAKKAKGSSKQAIASETRKSIEEQTAAFLKSGGKITQIARGASGQQSIAGPKHIVLGKNRG